MNSRQRRIRARRDRFRHWFETHRNIRISFDDLCAAVGCKPGKTSKAAMRKLRELFEEQDDGWFFPWAVPSQDCTYILTDDPAEAFDSRLHAQRMEDGIRRGKEKHDDFIRQHQDRLEPAERSVIEATLEVENILADAVGRLYEVRERTTKSTVASRREQRKAAEVEQ